MITWAHFDTATGTDRARRLGQASSRSDERANASMTLAGFPFAAGLTLNARAVRSLDRLEACPTFAKRPPPGSRGSIKDAP
jgi:hypothetical protein